MPQPSGSPAQESSVLPQDSVEPTEGEDPFQSPAPSTQRTPSSSVRRSKRNISTSNAEDEATPEIRKKPPVRSTKKSRTNTMHHSPPPTTRKSAGTHRPTDEGMDTGAARAPPPPSGNWAEVMASMLGAHEERFNERMDRSDQGLADKLDSVESRLGGRIHEVVEDLSALRKRVDSQEDGLEKKIESVVMKMNAGGRQRLTIAGQDRIRTHGAASSGCLLYTSPSPRDS